MNSADRVNGLDTSTPIEEKEDSKKHTNELKELTRDLEKKVKDLRELIEKDFASKQQE